MPIYQQERDNMNVLLRGVYFESYYVLFVDPAAQMAWHFNYDYLHPSPAIGQPSSQVQAIAINLAKPDKHVVLRSTIKGENVVRDEDIFYFQIKDSSIYNSGLRGSIDNAGQHLSWDLNYHHAQQSFYPSGYLLNKFKLLNWLVPNWLVPNWNVKLSGEIKLNNQIHLLGNLTASQGHRYGAFHFASSAWLHLQGKFEHNGKTHRYTLEFFAAELPIAMIHKKLKRVSLMVFKFDDEVYYFNQLFRLFANKAKYDIDGVLAEGTRGSDAIKLELATNIKNMVGTSSIAMDGSNLYFHQGYGLSGYIHFKHGKTSYTIPVANEGFFELMDRSPEAEVKFYL